MANVLVLLSNLKLSLSARDMDMEMELRLRRGAYDSSSVI